MNVSWSDVPGAEGYLIYRKNAEGKWKHVKTVKGTHGWTQTGLTSGQSYTYTVRAYWTYQRKRKYGGYPSGTTQKLIPAKTENFSAAPVSATSIRLKWSRVSGAEGYLVYRKNDAGNWQRIKEIKNGTTVAYTDTGRTIGKAYTYTVKAYWKSGKTTWYGTYPSGYTLTHGPGKTEVTNFEPIGKMKILVEWNPAINAEGYRIYRRKIDDKNGTRGVWTRVGTVTRENTTRFTDTVPTTDFYQYTVRAYRLVNGETLLGTYDQPDYMVRVY